jgi:hypothetical protein
VTRIAPSEGGAVTIHCDGTKLYMKGNSALARCTVLIPCEVSGKALFAIPVESLRNAIKGRKTLKVKYDKTMLSVVDGKYTSSLATIDAIGVDEEDSKDKGQLWKLSTEQVSWLKTSVSNVALKATESVTALFMPVTVKLTSKNAFVSCYDAHHMSFLVDKEITGDLDVTLPLDTFNTVLDVFNKSPCSMRVTDSFLYMKSKTVDCVLALPSKEEAGETVLVLDASELLSTAKETMNAKGTELAVEKDEMLLFLDNARAVASKERSELSVTLEDQKMLLEVKTSNGISKVALKCASKKKSSFKVDFEYLDEAVRKCGTVVEFRLVDSGALMFKTAKAYTVMSLNQD